MKSKILFRLLHLIALLALAVPAFSADYPTRDLQGIIMWGAGGGTDGMSRALTPNVEPFLGKEVVLVNKPGRYRRHRYPVRLQQ